jgi:thymidylate synthase ThyX
MVAQGYSVRILLDSLAPCGQRLTTWELRYPRFIHSELMTHRLFSRNSASSRAIPIDKLIAQVETDPALPVWWGKNQAGMQAPEELQGEARETAIRAWLGARDAAVQQARQLQALGLHKQLVNRVIEPWMFITVLVSATEFGNWYHLRRHRDAQPEIKWVADAMWEQQGRSSPTPLAAGAWHTPLLGFPGDEQLGPEERLKVAVGRCARVSYLTHTGQRDIAADLALHDRLAASGHWSPFEHVAAALTTPDWSGNFCGWSQYRKTCRGEHHAALPE